MISEDDWGIGWKKVISISIYLDDGKFISCYENIKRCGFSIVQHNYTVETNEWIYIYSRHMHFIRNIREEREVDQSN